MVSVSQQTIKINKHKNDVDKLNRDRLRHLLMQSRVRLDESYDEWFERIMIRFERERIKNEN